MCTPLLLVISQTPKLLVADEDAAASRNFLLPEGYALDRVTRAYGPCRYHTYRLRKPLPIESKEDGVYR